MAEQNTLRDSLEASFNEVEETPVQAIAAEPVVQETTEQQAQRERDEAGRFKAKAEEQPQVAQPVQQAPVVQPLQRPSTWKKEYLPIWDKLEKGVPLLPEEARKLAEYSFQRETEYKTGVSTYRQEAESAKQLNEAMAPFMPLLQQHNIQPTQWIQNLGNAHKALALGSPEEKLQMFAKLAQDYGVPLGAVGQAQQGQLDPIVPQLMQHIQALEGRVNTVVGWREQQEQTAIQQEIKMFQDTDKYPHFEQVRETMAGLLQAGLAQDLQTAYDKAVRMTDDVWEAEQGRQAQVNAAQQAQAKAAAAAKAKSHAVSTKSITPSGSANTNVKGLRASLEAAFDETASRV
jgi:hypothetical protein